MQTFNFADIYNTDNMPSPTSAFVKIEIVDLRTGEIFGARSCDKVFAASLDGEKFLTNWLYCFCRGIARRKSLMLQIQAFTQSDVKELELDFKPHFKNVSEYKAYKEQIHG